MYFWNIKALKEELARGSLTESNSFKYLLADSLLIALGTLPLFDNPNSWDRVSVILDSFIMAVGIYYFYHCNQGSKGEYVLQRYLSLDWVFSLRFAALFVLPLVFVYEIFLSVIFPGYFETTTLFDVLFSGIITALYYWKLGKHAQDVVKIKEVLPHSTVLN